MLRDKIEGLQLHLTIALQMLHDNRLYAKQSKCFFGHTSIEYLGHVISNNGVITDPEKITVVTNWPQPTTLKQLRGFLGLTGYYRLFVRNYGRIAKPLTDMLQKDAFQWNNVGIQAFSYLKQGMISAPILAIPDLSKEFGVETDASG